MATVNEWLLSEAIRHAVDLVRYGNGLALSVIARLNRSDKHLFAVLSEAIEQGNDEPFSMDRLQALLKNAQAINQSAFADAARELTGAMRQFVEYETAYQKMALDVALMVKNVTVPVSVEQVYAAATSKPFQGVLLKGALNELTDQRMKLVERTIAQGFVESKTTGEIVRELRGTRAAGYADGLVNRSRRDMQSVVRTALGHYAGETQDRVMAANSDLLRGVQWSATLDNRTTPGCRLRDGALYTPETHEPIGHAIPWGAGPGRVHWGCRCAQVPVTKSWRALGWGDLPEPTRASMNGQVPEFTTYAGWLAAQSAEMQDDILGPTRGKLYRQGGMSMKDMYTKDGQWMTLDELRARDAKAFARSGL